MTGRLMRLLALAIFWACACGAIASARPGGSLISPNDLERPLFGAKVSLSGDSAVDAILLARASENLDFVVVDSLADARACAAAKARWAAVLSLARPGGFDRASWDAPLDRLRSQVRELQDVPGLACWFVRDEDTPDTERAGLTSDETSEFGRWLQGRYLDELPGNDTNGDGRTANGQLGFELAGWELLTPEQAGEASVLEAQMDWRRSQRDAFLLEAAKLVSVHDPLRAVVPVWRSGPTSGPSLGQDPLPRSQGLGITFNPGRTAVADAAHSARLEETSVVSTFPASTASAFIEWELTVPPQAELTMGYGLRAGSGPARMLVRITVGVRPILLMDEKVAAVDGMQNARISLADYAGEIVRLRLEARPDGMGQVVAVWQAPAIDTPEQHAMLVEPANWWQAKIGYRKSIQPGAEDLITGPAGAKFDGALAEAAMAGGAAAADAARTRLVLFDVHPTGDVSTGGAKELAALVCRALPYRPAAICIGPADAGGLLPEIGRWRTLLAAAAPYSRMKNERAVTVAAEKIDTRVLSTLESLDDTGYRLAGPDRFDPATREPLLAFAVGPGQAMSEALEEVLSGEQSRRSLVFYEERPHQAGAKFAAHAPWAPSAFAAADAAGRQVQAGAASMGITSVTTAEWKPVEGWEAVTDGGQTVGVRSKNTLVAFGEPSPDTGTAIVDWLGVRESDIDSGWVRVVRKSARASSESVYCLEGQGRLYIPSATAGWDLVEHRMAIGEVQGPGAWYCFPRTGAKVTEVTGAYPASVEQLGGNLIVRLTSYGTTAESPGASLVFWTAQEPDKDLRAGEAWKVVGLGDGFWKAESAAAGEFTLNIPGAATEPSKKRWVPYIDH